MRLRLRDGQLRCHLPPSRLSHSERRHAQPQPPACRPAVRPAARSVLRPGDEGRHHQWRGVPRRHRPAVAPLPVQEHRRHLGRGHRCGGHRGGRVPAPLQRQPCRLRPAEGAARRAEGRGAPRTTQAAEPVPAAAGHPSAVRRAGPCAQFRQHQPAHPGDGHRGHQGLLAGRRRCCRAGAAGVAGGRQAGGAAHAAGVRHRADRLDDLPGHHRPGGRQRLRPVHRPDRRPAARGADTLAAQPDPARRRPPAR